MTSANNEQTRHSEQGTKTETTPNHPSPVFGPCLMWPNGWMDQHATWYGGRPRPSRHCLRWGPSFPRKGTQQPHTFRPMSIVAKRSPISATAELLSLSAFVGLPWHIYREPYDKLQPYERGRQCCCTFCCRTFFM